MRLAILILAISLGFSERAAADPALGLWLTEPDKRGQVAHVQITKCAQALCGKVVETLDSAGKKVKAKSLGRRVFWDMVPRGGNRYEGRAWVPAHDREYAAEMRLNGNNLTVRGCLGPVCMGQKWKRLQ